MRTSMLATLIILFFASCRHSTQTGNVKLVDNNIEFLRKLPDLALTKFSFYPAVYVFDTTQKGDVLGIFGIDTKYCQTNLTSQYLSLFLHDLTGSKTNKGNLIYFKNGYFFDCYDDFRNVNL